MAFTAKFMYLNISSYNTPATGRPVVYLAESSHWVIFIRLSNKIKGDNKNIWIPDQQSLKAPGVLHIVIPSVTLSPLLCQKPLLHPETSTLSFSY